MEISFVPALIFLTSDGDELFRAEAYLRSFHLNIVLEFARDGAIQKNPEFQRFLQERADELRNAGQTVSIW